MGKVNALGVKGLKGWNRVWMSMLFQIDGFDGLYCSDCVREIRKELQDDSDD